MSVREAGTDSRRLLFQDQRHLLRDRGQVRISVQSDHRRARRVDAGLRPDVLFRGEDARVFLPAAWPPFLWGARFAFGERFLGPRDDERALFGGVPDRLRGRFFGLRLL